MVNNNYAQYWQNNSIKQTNHSHKQIRESFAPTNQLSHLVVSGSPKELSTRK